MGQAAADVDGVLGMMAADDGAAERCRAMVMAANVVVVAVSYRDLGVGECRAGRSIVWRRMSCRSQCRIEILGGAHAPEPLGATMALKDQWKSVLVHSNRWPHARARGLWRIPRGGFPLSDRDRRTHSVVR